MTAIQAEIRRALADAYTFVRSQEVNRAVQAVTMVQLLREQVDRNGDTERSNATQFNPYTYDPDKTTPATQQPLSRANFLSGSDTGNPTRLDRVLAIQSSITDLVEKVKKIPIEDVNATALPDSTEPIFSSDPLVIGSDELFADLLADSGGALA